MTLKAPVALVTAGLMTLALSACSSDDGPSVSQPSSPAGTSSQAQPTPNASANQPTDSPTESTSATTEPTESSPSTDDSDKPLAKGQCLGPQPSYTRVECSQPHTFEIFYTKDDAKHSSDLVKRGAYATSTCYTQGAKFLGNGGFGVSRLAVETVPTSVNTNSDKTIACMIKEYRTSGTGLATATSSWKGKLKGDGFYDYNLCVQGKASETEIKIVVCSEPHTSEAIGGRINGGPNDTYPKNGQKIHADARKYCKPLAKKFLGASRGDIGYAENSGGEKPWSEGKKISGCFVEIKSGKKTTKTLKGIKNKSLKSYT